MCHFITAVVGGCADVSRLNVIANKYHRWLTPIDNASVQPFLAKGETYFSTLRRGATCDCGTSLGWWTQQRQRAPKPLSADAEAAKFRRKGWTENKISRWLESKHLDRRMSPPPDLDETVSDTRNDNWLSMAHEYLDEADVTSFGLLVHWYRSGLENRIPMAGREETELSRTALASMMDCKLYVFRK